MSKKEFPIIYKYTQTGAIQQWQIVVEDGSFYTIEGHKDGKLTTSKPTVCTGKNIGKKNETSCEEQALTEAASKHQKKLDKGYNETLTDKKNFLEVMLAHPYEDYPIDWEAVEKGELDIYGQPKLDGLRAANEENTLMSRNGKPYVSCPHLYQSGFCLDGELYTHEYKDDFNKIVSLCKKQKPTAEELEEAKEKVQFWAYDMPKAKGTFSERYKQLKRAIGMLKNDSFVLVPTTKINSLQELKDFHAKNIGDGYEGTIIRVDNKEYEGKRSKQLLKYKDFIDEEFTIVAYEEGTGGRVGTIGFFTLKHDTNPNLTFKSNVKGNFEFLKEVWKDRDSYVGKTATVKYFQRTPTKEDGTGNVPRFPYIIKIAREDVE